MANSLSKITMMLRVNRSSLLIILCLTFFVTGCKKLVTVPPPTTQLSSDNVFSNSASAAAVLTGIYTQIALENPQYGTSINSISLTAGLSADELTLAGGSANVNTLLVQFYENGLTGGSSSTSNSLWTNAYSNIYITNIALERLPGSTALPLVTKNQLMGEAKFIRGFLYFYLINLFGDVPLITSSAYTTNNKLGRSPAATVYAQITADLTDATKLLSPSYVSADATTSTSERTRPNKWGAMAMLSRVYLYENKWDSAIAMATSVIQNSPMYGLDSLDNIFLKNSSEAIWQLQPVNAGWNTEDARLFVLPLTGPTTNLSPGYPVYLAPQLLAAFEPGDQRRLQWVDSVAVDNTTYYYAYKYKSATIYAPVTEYMTVLRLGELFLIRAEAESQSGKIAAATADLNMIRNRARLPNYIGGMDKSSLLAAILHEREIELFTEWGHRWLDLKRSQTVNDVMAQVTPLKGGTWKSDWALYPIPVYDIVQDPALQQNNGY